MFPKHIYAIDITFKFPKAANLLVKHAFVSQPLAYLGFWYKICPHQNSMLLFYFLPVSPWLLQTPHIQQYHSQLP
jgi:hypothetical protein